MLAAMASKPHVVMFPYPAQGHINPMLQLAKRLSSHAVHVTLITLEYFVARISQAQEIKNLPTMSNISFMGIPDGLPDDSDRHALAIGQVVEHIGETLEEALLKLMKTEPPITCIVGDCFVSRVRDVANKLHIPRVVFWPQSATVFSMHIYSQHIIANGFNPFEGTVKTFGPKEPMELISCIPGVPPVHPACLPFDSSFGVSGLKYIQKWIQEQLGNLHEAIAVIGNTVEELEPNVCEALPNLQPLGPLIPSSFLGDENSQDNKAGTSFWKEDDCIQWLDLQPPSSVLYISFGSVTKLLIVQLHELAHGLLASQQRFLWAIRPGSVVESANNVLEALPEGFLDQTTETSKIINWAPQPLVLAHPSVGGFFSHCGWNSTLESISMGVPLLGWPQIMDQITNCWMVANQWKIGLELQRDKDNKTNRVEVERAVRELMEGESRRDMRTRVVKLRNAARRSVEANGGGSSHKNLQHFVKQLFHVHKLMVIDEGCLSPPHVVPTQQTLDNGSIPNCNLVGVPASMWNSSN